MQRVLHTVPAQALRDGCRQDVVRVNVLGELFLHGAQQLAVFGVYHPVEIRRSADRKAVWLQVREERGGHLGAVGIGHSHADRQRHAGLRSSCREKRECRGKQKETDAALMVKSHDVADYGEGRVVDDHAAGGIFVSLVVAARIEGPHKACPIHLIRLGHPVGHGLVDLRRGVAVVGRFLGLELIDKSLVLLILPSVYEEVVAHGCLQSWRSLCRFLESLLASCW